MKKITFLYIFIIAFVLWTKVIQAQISLPPSGENQKAIVTQFIGLASVTIQYSSPDVHGPNGEDRSGHIWGELVPFGLTNLQFGISSNENPSPWRAGANENTTITFSHDMLVEGKQIKAGIYGLHMIPSEKEWTIIFSYNSTAWGSYAYQQSEDALRVKVTPTKSAYQEWLTYDYIERKSDGCIATLKWENLSIPIKISVPNSTELYIHKIRRELQDAPGFNYNSYVDAALFCATNKVNLEEALTWANEAISGNTFAFTARKDFTTMSCKATVLDSMGRHEEANKIMLEAIQDLSAPLLSVHYYARSLQQQKRNAEALEIFLINYKRHPDEVVTHLGLARAYSSIGEYKKALKYVQSGLALNPNPQIKSTLEEAKKKLELNQDFN